MSAGGHSALYYTLARDYRYTSHLQREAVKRLVVFPRGYCQRVCSSSVSLRGRVSCQAIMDVVAAREVPVYFEVEEEVISAPSKASNRRISSNPRKCVDNC